MEEEIREKVDELIKKLDIPDENITQVGARYKTVTLNIPKNNPAEYSKIVIYHNGHVGATIRGGGTKYLTVDDLLK